LATIHIVRLHTQGLAQARKIALAWAQELETEYGMECHHQKGKAKDALQFRGRGVSGTLHITPKQFELDATLGLFLGVFKGKIEAAIVHKLDAHLALAPGQVNARSVRGHAPLHINFFRYGGTGENIRCQRSTC